MKDKIYYASLAALIVFLVYALFNATSFSPLAFDEEALANLGTVLAPLVAVAAFIERSVEVILTPLRGDAAEELQKSVDAANAANMPDAAAEKELREHKQRTRHYAFVLGVALGLIASLLGVRALANLVSTSPLPAPIGRLDVFLTGLLLGGGAEGFHKIVKAVTSYADLIAKKNQAAAAQT